MRSILLIALVAQSGCAASNRTLALEARARGVRIYECGAKGVWLSKGIEAELYDRDGKPIGRELAGRTWEAADGSSVVGGAAHGPEPGVLSFQAQSSSGTGVLAGTSTVERIDAAGGDVPSAGCSATNEEGDVARVAYEATYRFYREPHPEPAIGPGVAATI